MNLIQFLDLCDGLDICKKNIDGVNIEYVFTTNNAVSKLNNDQLNLLSHIIKENWQIVLFNDDGILKVSFDYIVKEKK